ncbi:GlcNAc-PI de-N-acetylase [Anaerolineae bacterium CFX9]|nr:GlcNAc-PI de-N-acetylase [Anaerolineae bacterium CFX9]
MSHGRLLISYAHPDDESFGLGGLIARYVERGVEVSLICATNGDVGTVDPALLNGYDSVAALRLAELDAAAELLKFTHVYKLGYRDSGMMGSETSHDPASLWMRWQTEPEVITRRVVEVMREVRPHVVITFNKYGGYGHPDHIAIQQATTQAFYLAGDSAFLTGQPPYATQKLYYSGINAATLRLGIWQMRLMGKDPRRLGRNQDIDLIRILEHVEPAHASINIRHYFDIWDAASACHKSQLGGRSGFGLPSWARRILFPTQRFTRVHPAPAHNRIDETDLFANVRIEDPVAEMA